MLSWTMGEVRHNVWYSPENNEAPLTRKRMLYLAGLSVSMETALRAMSQVRVTDGHYATDMRARAVLAKSKLVKAAAVLQAIPELQTIVAVADPTMTAADELTASAEAVAEQARRLLERNGEAMEALDALLPGPEGYVGSVANP